jgi:hypothetical protein
MFFDRVYDSHLIDRENLEFRETKQGFLRYVSGIFEVSHVCLFFFFKYRDFDFRTLTVLAGTLPLKAYLRLLLL